MCNNTDKSKTLDYQDDDLIKHHNECLYHDIISLQTPGTGKDCSDEVTVNCIMLFCVRIVT